MTAYSKAFPKTFSKAFPSEKFPVVLLGSSGIPNLSHLLVLATGSTIHGGLVDQDPDAVQDPNVDYKYYRRDSKSGFHLFITDNGETITQKWTSGAATYLAHHDVLLIDEAQLVAADALEGPFFFDGAGNEVQRTWADIVAYAADKNSVFAGQNGLLIYDEALTGDDIAAANDYVG